MKKSLALLLSALAWACSTPPPHPVTVPEPPPASRLAEADAQVRAGCHDCLADALARFTALREVPAAAEAATAGAARATGLLALRERELGMADEGLFARVEGLAAAATTAPVWLAQIAAMLDALPAQIGAGRPPTSDADIDRMMRLRANRTAWLERLRTTAPLDELAAYTWLTLTCSDTSSDALAMDAIVAPVSSLAATPLIRFKLATCRGVKVEELLDLEARDPRFIETVYMRGLLALGERRLDEADRLVDQAYAWHPRWPAASTTLANLAMTAEDFARALTYYQRTLDLVPNSPDARLGLVRAETYENRHEEAIANADTMLEARWNMGDALYWRALNQSALERLDLAWADVDAADKLLVNAEVPKLAGTVAYRRGQVDTARTKFELAHQRNPLDCETAHDLGVVLAEQRTWTRAVEVLTGATRCLTEAESDLQEEITKLRAGGTDRERRLMARRELQLTSARRMRAGAWLNTAVAYLGLEQPANARPLLESLSDDEQYGERARQLLARLK